MSEIWKIFNKFNNEFQENKRLQWMVLAVLVCIYFITLTGLLDRLAGYSSLAAQNIAMSTRMQNMTTQTISSKLSDELRTRADEKLAALPRADSRNIAEARALKEFEEIINPLLTNTRMTLIDSEEIRTDSETFWQVTIEISGKLPASNAIKLLTEFDSSVTHRRISIFRYRMDSSIYTNFVSKLLFAKINNA
ncbi:MAG: hypothetical protein CL828_06115 [Crocinitomicaceae bacterium]|nr:hypothetical protein [Crocinitomicaceae bacterium]